MRILFLHNRYRLQGGEERAVAEIAGLLQRRGHTVEILERSSAQLGGARAARSLLRGGEDPDEVERVVRSLRAEIVHAHNLHPLFGWRALAAARRQGARTIMHLHNFRLYCAIGVAYREGAPCHQCRGRDTAPGLIHRCRGSIPEAAAYAAGLAVQQRRLLQSADRLIALSHAHAALLSTHGLPAERVSVVPNFAPAPAEQPPTQKPTHVLVAGRLVEEKGFDVAVRAAAAAGVPLVIAGQGPDERRLRQLAAGAEIRFTGWIEPDELGRLRAGAAAVLAPSRCEEACPYSVLEALAAGVPALVSDRGGLPEMVPDDQVLPAGDPDAWAERIRALWRDDQGRRSRNEAALALARGKFGEARAYEALMAVYEGG